MEAKPPARHRALVGAGRKVVVATSILALGGVTAVAVAADGEPQAASSAVIALRPLDPLQGFTVFAEQGATVKGNEIEGSLATGGDLTIASGANYGVGLNNAARWTATGDAKPTALYVGGRVVWQGGSVHVLNDNFAHIVDGAGATVVPNGGVTHIRPTSGSGQIDVNSSQPAGAIFGAPANAIDFAGAFATLRANSAAIGSCEANLATTNANGAPTDWNAGNLNVYLRLAAGQTNVLNLTSDQLARVQTFTFANGVPSDASLLINVTDWSTGEWDAPNFSGIGLEQARRIFINFPTATALTLKQSARTVEGTIFAPNAALAIGSNSNVEGAVVAGTLSHTGGGEIHDASFTPTISCTTPTTTTPTTPTDTTPTTTTPTTTPTTTTPTTTTPTTTTPTTTTPTTTTPTTTTPTTTTPTTTTPTTTTPTTTTPTTTTPTPAATTPAPAATTTTPAPTPESPTGRGDVRGTVRSGGGRRPRAAARITGSVGCIKETAQARITGRQLRTIVFRLDGRVVKTVRAGGKRTVGLELPASKLADGVNTLTARVTFTRVSRARPKTLKLSFSRCARGAVQPAYTG
jgi:choice-of-anchor A domain-containing protein